MRRFPRGALSRSNACRTPSTSTTPRCDSTSLQAALAKGEPVQYNKENPLNPFFVVYGRR